jgi:hypothetical protein
MSQRNQIAFDPVPDIRLEICRRHQIDRRPDDPFELGLETSQPEQPEPRRKIRKQIDVTVVAILAPSNAAEHPKIARTVTRSNVDQLLPTQSHPPTDRAAQSIQTPWRLPKPQVQFEPRRLNQSHQHR